MSEDSLESKIRSAGGAVPLLRRTPAGAYQYPIPSEFTNWRSEQAAWKTTAILLDQSFHMTDIYLKGPDVLRLLSDTGVNSFRTFGKNKAKEFIACNPDGYVIGDVILFGLDDDEVSLVGRPAVPDWLTYQIETNGYNVDVTRDERLVANPAGKRLVYRFQVQGPNALQVVEKAAGGSLPKIKFFNIGRITIAGHTVRALNHTMTGTPGHEKTGLELIGPAEQGPAVKEALLAAGEEFGLEQGGSLSYPTTALETGWIGLVMPAIYSGDAMQPFREWLGGNSWEAQASLGGSYASENIEDYYARPWDLGFGHIIKYDHDFIGRAALEKAANQPQRRKVWLRWSDEDVSRVITDSLFGKGDRPKYMDLPSAVWSNLQFDAVLSGERLVGLSTWNGYTVNVGGWSSLAMIDEDAAVDGAGVTVAWGEPDGGKSKHRLEPHVQTEIRAKVSTRALA